MVEALGIGRNLESIDRKYKTVSPSPLLIIPLALQGPGRQRGRCRYNPPPAAVVEHIRSLCKLMLLHQLRQNCAPFSFEIAVDYFSDSGPDLVGSVTVMATFITDFGRPTESVRTQLVRLEGEDDDMKVATVTISE